MVPTGTPLLLKEGDQVVITQSLGGGYTVYTSGVLARIDGRNADALGLKPEEALDAGQGSKTAAGPVDEKLVWDQMRTCFDPEIPVNIVDLGLIYDCLVKPLPEGGNLVLIKMTMTAPGCGMSEYLKDELETKVRNVPGVTDVRVEVVWDPPWNQLMITEAGRLELGLM